MSLLRWLTYASGIGMMLTYTMNLFKWLCAWISGYLRRFLAEPFFVSEATRFYCVDYVSELIC